MCPLTCISRVKRYEEEARIDNDEVRQNLGRVTNGIEEKLARCTIYVVKRNTHFL